MKLFSPPWKTERAPYGVEDVDGMAKLPCPTGYLAKGFLEMNRDLRLAFDKMNEVIRERDTAIGRYGRMKATLIRQLRNKK